MKSRLFPVMAIAAFITIIGAFSCTKYGDDRYPNVPTALVNIVNVSPTSTSLDYAFEPNWIAPGNFAYRSYSGYLRVQPGQRTFDVYPHGSNTKLLSQTITLVGDKFYSLFIVDTASKMNAVLLRDSTKAAMGDSVRIRYANMSPDVASLNFYISGNAQAVGTNVAYETATDFVSMKAGRGIQFMVSNAAGGTTLAKSDSFYLQPGGVYTILSSGYAGISSGTGAIRVGRMVH